jgi:alpha-aminoadipic semialdehyde synthase
MTSKLFKIGIRREEFSKWERRVVLVPSHCRKLLFQFRQSLQIKVQPSDVRIYSNSKFEEAGCLISEDISDCDLILGVKQVPIDKLYCNKTFMFFSHTIKAQEQNMAMLDAILEKKITLIDYEKIADKQGNRLVAFGQFAGNAGAIDILMGLGSFLLNRGIGTPFINICQSHHYKNIDNAKDSIRSVGNAIESSGLCEKIVPFIVGVTGSGRCATGTLEILKLLPHELIAPEDLDDLLTVATQNPHQFNKQIYICQFHQKHLVTLKEPSDAPFDKEHYYANPEVYKGIFEKKFLPYLSVLVNNIYWDDRFPRLVTEDNLKRHLEKGRPLRLLAISDVTADFQGSIDFLKKFTTIDHPFFVYDPKTGNATDDFKSASEGILYCSIENHPSQFPLDASNYFSTNLIQFLPNIVRADPSKPILERGMDDAINRAVITHDGKLTHLFTYITKLRTQKAELHAMGAPDTSRFRAETKNQDTYNMYLEGHIFDSHAINSVFDILVDKYDLKCIIVKWVLGQGPDKETSCVVKIAEDPHFEQAFKEVDAILKLKNIRMKLIDEEHVE